MTIYVGPYTIAPGDTLGGADIVYGGVVIDEGETDGTTIDDGGSGGISFGDFFYFTENFIPPPYEFYVSNGQDYKAYEGGPPPTGTVFYQNGYYQFFSGGALFVAEEEVTGAAYNTTVESGGGGGVMGGGVLSATTVESGGSLGNDQGTDYDTVLASGSYEEVLEGTTISATVNGGAELEVQGYYGSFGFPNVSASAVGTVVNDGGEMILDGDVSATFTVNAGGTLGIEDRYSLEVFSVGDGVSLIIWSGGIANNTTVENGGSVTISSGGVAEGTTVCPGGTELISSGGKAFDTTLSAFGTELISSGGYAESTTVGGDQFIFSGGEADLATVSSGGVELVSAGGAAYVTTVSSSGDQIVLSGGQTTHTTLSSGGVELVSAGGAANVTTVSSGGDQFINSGGTAVATTVSSGGSEFVFGGGFASNTVIGGGGYAIISGGALELEYVQPLESGTITFSGSGGVLKLDGATISLDTMTTGVVGGFAIGDTIDLTSVSFSAGGAIQLLSGNILQIVEGGGSATIQLDPNQNFNGSSFKLSSDGGSGTDINLQSGLSINLTFDSSVSGAPAGFTSAIQAAASYFENTFSNAATLNLDIKWGSGGGAESLTPPAGNKTYNFNQVSAADLSLSGRSDVTSGGSFFITEAQGKALGLVSNNGENNNSAFDGSISFGSLTPWNTTNSAVSGSVYITGVAEHEISETMGRLDFLNVAPPNYSVLDLFRYSAPNVAALTPFMPAYFSIDGGTTNLGTFNLLATVSSGAIGDLGDWDNTVSSTAGDPYDAFTNFGILNPATPLDIQVMNAIGWNTRSGAVANVASGGVVSGMVVSSGGQLNVASGGVASGSVIASAGAEAVYGADISGTVQTGGAMLVYGGGTAVDTTVDSGGFEYVDSGGAADNTTINGGGELELGGPAVINLKGGADVLIGSDGGESPASVSVIGSAQVDDNSTLEFANAYLGVATFNGSSTGPGGKLQFDGGSTGPINVVNPNDTVIAQPGSDNWINAIVNYTLPANVDALFLYAGSQGTGNSDASGDALYALDAGNAQTLTGNSPNDTFVVYNSSDVVAPKAGSHDVVYAAASFALPTGVDTLILEGGATQGVGNSDVSGDGLFAANPGQVATLTGNSPNDTFVVYNSADVVVPKAGSHDVVYSAVSYTLPTGVDVLILEASASQGVGNSDAAGDALYAANPSQVATLTGNSANDTFVIYNSADVVVPKAGSHDIVYSAVNYTLPTGVDSLILEAGTQAIGNSDATGDTLYAANAGVAQTLTGNSHNDTFVVYNSGDTVIGQAGSTDTVYAAASFTLPTNVDTLFLEGNASLGSGNSDANNLLVGNGGVASTLVAGSGTDLLVVAGTAGTTLTGGIGHDTFAFPNVMGHDEVTNFGIAKDTLQFNATLFSNFTAAMNAASQSGANTVFTIDANDTVTLDSVTKTSLTAGNFHFT